VRQNLNPNYINAICICSGKSDGQILCCEKTSEDFWHNHVRCKNLHFRKQAFDAFVCENNTVKTEKYESMKALLLSVLESQIFIRSGTWMDTIIFFAK